MNEEKMEGFGLTRVTVRLVPDARLVSDSVIDTPKKAVHLVGEELCDMDREVIAVIHLDSKGKPINCIYASVGALNYAMTEPRELLKGAILSNAASIILIHNHPSGDPLPSSADVDLTKKMKCLCDMVGIGLLDHVVVGSRMDYYSMDEHGLIKDREQKAAPLQKPGRKPKL